MLKSDGPLAAVALSAGEIPNASAIHWMPTSRPSGSTPDRFLKSRYSRINAWRCRSLSLEAIVSSGERAWQRRTCPNTHASLAGVVCAAHLAAVWFGYECAELVHVCVKHPAVMPEGFKSGRMTVDIRAVQLKCDSRGYPLIIQPSERSTRFGFSHSPLVGTSTQVPLSASSSRSPTWLRKRSLCWLLVRVQHL